MCRPCATRAIKVFLNPNMRQESCQFVRYRSIDFLLPECQQSTQWEFNWANYHSTECWELSHILSCFRPPGPRPPPCPSWAPITWQHPGFKHSLQLNLQLTEMLTIFSQSITNLNVQWKPWSLLLNEWEGQRVHLAFVWDLQNVWHQAWHSHYYSIFNFLWYVDKHFLIEWLRSFPRIKYMW